MTTIALIPFNGATRKGIEHIQAFINEGASKARAAIDVAVKENGETIVDIVHPAESGFQTDWELETERRKRWISSEKGDVKTLGFFLAIATGLASFLSCIGFQDKTTSDPFALGILFATLALGIAVIGGYHYAKFAADFFKERARGYTGYFTKRNGRRIHQAWAMTADAVYISNRDDEADTLTVTRVAYRDIQACAHRKEDGYVGASLFDKEGNPFYILSPASERIANATRLVELVNAKIPR
ncbi:hypothetical protein [Rhizobium sp. BK176]|uniref:hypothetical protein n=1 Tax=Rhizobium sp. BK176 TaxID=2587071 RepID=UPI002168B210|nr:hypothetical protein [Rhizobium sp. BK176]MCS4088993.1 hypothetical protein [Rhizobium sp. BK176]